MTKQQELEVMKIISTMLANKKQPNDEQNLFLFRVAIEDLSHADVMKAIKHILKTGTKGYLEPADIVKAAGPSDSEAEDEANEQWQIFSNMVRYYPVTSFDDVITAFIAQKTIPVGECKNMSELAFERVEKKFINEYKKIRANKVMTEQIIDGALDLRSLSKDAKARLVEEGRVKLPLQLTEEEMRAAWKAIAATR
jgi:hypothetical protein